MLRNLSLSMNFLFYFNRLAFSYLKDYQSASVCYKKACELDPDNEGYQRNYQLTMNNLQTISGSPSQSSNDFPLTSSSNLMETAARIMTDNPDVSTVYAIIFY